MLDQLARTLLSLGSFQSFLFFPKRSISSLSNHKTLYYGILTNIAFPDAFRELDRDADMVYLDMHSILSMSVRHRRCIFSLSLCCCLLLSCIGDALI